MWAGPTPRVVIMDPEMVKEITNNSEHFKKPPVNPLVKILAGGLASLEDEKWAKRRKAINPAFHLEKLKVIFHIQFDCYCCVSIN